ncbi:Actin cross-linking protein, putative (DUF569) [Quillaja saponaria]|uniref:Actin cross-linking protein, putative (DUF569) n=1 Tax=Quillaja saponaria TaxID=32244 RepID=A0AAD7VC31_QUISA|nr:Actin cross-linking protein, putative (DUF569) [Quillaja saponaria]
MEFFQKAKVVRFRSHHDKYLLADDDQETVCQDRNGSVINARWNVEIVENDNVIRLRSCYSKYLTASNMPFLLGMTGKKVLQTLPSRLDSSVEWEPIREGVQVRLKTRYGQYLRANGGVPPWRNSITHDIPHRTATQDWVLWDVDVLEFHPRPSKPQSRPQSITPPDRSPSQVSLSSPVRIELRSPRQENQIGDSLGEAPLRCEGRIIYFNVANEKGDVDNVKDEKSFTFKGSGVEELKGKLKEETGLDDILVCSRNPLNGKLYPMLLHLPPNNTDMHIVVVPLSSKE